MFRSLHRVFLPFLCVALLAGGSLAQMAVTATPASAATTAPIVLTSNGPTVTGQTITFGVNMTGPAGTPTGTVDIFDGAATICPGLVLTEPVSGTASTFCQVSNLAVGSHDITASYRGDSAYSPATSAVVSQVVSKASTTTVAARSGATTNPAPFSAPVSFTASVTTISPGSGVPTGTVEFRDNDVTITACAARALTEGVATCDTGAIGRGTHTITTSYNGSPSYLGSTDFTAQEIGKADTATVVTSSDLTTSANEPVTYTATISPTSPAAATPNAGTVTFAVDGSAITACTSQPVTAGVATCATASEPVGAPTITAEFSGSDDFNGSLSSGIVQTIAKSPTATTLLSGTNPAVVGGSVTFTASVAATAPGTGVPNGTLTFLAGDTGIVGCVDQLLTNGTATCTTSALPVGDSSITAVYAASTSYLTSTSSVTSQTIAKQGTTVIVASSDATTTRTEAVTFTATLSPVAPATATPNAGAVAFRLAGTPITGCTARPVSAGLATCTTSVLPVGAALSITGLFSGDATWATSTSTAISQTVAKANATTVISSSNTSTVFGEAVTLTATISPIAPATGTPAGGTVGFTDGGNPISTCAARSVTAGVATCTTTGLEVGSHVLVAIASGDADFDPSTSGSLAQTVDRSASRTNLTPLDSPARAGQNIRFRVRVTSTGNGAGTPTGQVALYRTRTDGSFQWIGVVSLRAGIGTISVGGFPVGQYTVLANYRGSAHHLRSHQTASQRIGR